MQRLNWDSITTLMPSLGTEPDLKRLLKTKELCVSLRGVFFQRQELSQKDHTSLILKMTAIFNWWGLECDHSVWIIRWTKFITGRWWLASWIELSSQLQFIQQWWHMDTMRNTHYCFGLLHFEPLVASSWSSKTVPCNVYCCSPIMWGLGDE